MPLTTTLRVEVSIALCDQSTMFTNPLYHAPQENCPMKTEGRASEKTAHITAGSKHTSSPTISNWVMELCPVFIG